MATLLLMRHAQAAAQSDGTDLERPLTAAGRARADEVRGWLAEQEIDPQLILVSPATRCRSTAAAVAPTTAAVVDPRLYQADPDQLCAQIRELPLLGHDPQALLVVAHNPGLGQLVRELSQDLGPDRGLPRGWPPGTLAVFETDDPWAAFSTARLTAVCAA